VGELAFTALQSVLDLAQAVCAPQLAEHPRNELLPATRAMRVPLRIVLGNQLGKVSAWKKPENLTAD
jgi:hypothetical protein